MEAGGPFPLFGAVLRAGPVYVHRASRGPGSCPVVVRERPRRCGRRCGRGDHFLSGRFVLVGRVHAPRLGLTEPGYLFLVVVQPIIRNHAVKAVLGYPWELRGVRQHRHPSG